MLAKRNSKVVGVVGDESRLSSNTTTPRPLDSIGVGEWVERNARDDRVTMHLNAGHASHHFSSLLRTFDHAQR